MQDRRQFAATSAAFVLGTASFNAATRFQTPESKIPAELVGKFIGKAHGDLDTVKQLLTDEPALVNASWDWGKGDWETGLNAASHVGRRDIAELLLEHGARIDLPAAVMLGMKPVVEEILNAAPKMIKVSGAHEIPLLSHAIFGGRKADDVFALLIAKGADVNGASKMKMTPLMAAASKGRLSQLKTLLDRGADPRVKDTKGRSALDVAKKRKHDKCAKALQKSLG